MASWLRFTFGASNQAQLPIKKTPVLGKEMKTKAGETPITDYLQPILCELKGTVSGLPRSRGICRVMGRMKRLLCLLVIPTLAASSLTLEWDKPTDGATVSYVLYQGTASGVYSVVTPFKYTTNEFTVTIPNIGTSIYFALSAKDVLGRESVKGTELVFVYPSVAAVPTGLRVAATNFVTFPQQPGEVPK